MQKWWTIEKVEEWLVENIDCGGRSFEEVALEQAHTVPVQNLRDLLEGTPVPKWDDQVRAVWADRRETELRRVAGVECEQDAMVLGLPDEVVLKVFSELGVADLVSAASVCRDWDRVASDKSLWGVHWKKYLSWVQRPTENTREKFLVEIRKVCKKCGRRGRNVKERGGEYWCETRRYGSGCWYVSPKHKRPRWWEVVRLTEEMRVQEFFGSKSPPIKTFAELLERPELDEEHAEHRNTLSWRELRQMAHDSARGRGGHMMSVRAAVELKIFLLAVEAVRETWAAHPDLAQIAASRDFAEDKVVMRTAHEIGWFCPDEPMRRIWIEWSVRERVPLLERDMRRQVARDFEGVGLVSTELLHEWTEQGNVRYLRDYGLFPVSWGVKVSHTSAREALGASQEGLVVLDRLIDRVRGAGQRLLHVIRVHSMNLAITGKISGLSGPRAVSVFLKNLGMEAEVEDEVDVDEGVRRVELLASIEKVQGGGAVFGQLWDIVLAGRWALLDARRILADHEFECSVGDFSSGSDVLQAVNQVAALSFAARALNIDQGALFRALPDGEWTRRMIAESAVSLARGTRLYTGLVRFLGDEETVVRTTAAKILDEKARHAADHAKDLGKLRSVRMMWGDEDMERDVDEVDGSEAFAGRGEVFADQGATRRTLAKGRFCSVNDVFLALGYSLEDVEPDLRAFVDIFWTDDRRLFTLKAARTFLKERCWSFGPYRRELLNRDRTARAARIQVQASAILIMLSLFFELGFEMAERLDVPFPYIDSWCQNRTRIFRLVLDLFKE